MKSKTVAIISMATAVITQTLQPLMVVLALQERGYFAVGGEWICNVVGIAAIFYGIQAVVNMAEEHKQIQTKYVSALYRNAFEGLKSYREDNREKLENAG